jgi:hypothetical protein
MGSSPFGMDDYARTRGFRLPPERIRKRQRKRVHVRTNQLYSLHFCAGFAHVARGEEQIERTSDYGALTRQHHPISVQIPSSPLLHVRERSSVRQHRPDQPAPKLRARSEIPAEHSAPSLGPQRAGLHEDLPIAGLHDNV